MLFVEGANFFLLLQKRMTWIAFILYFTASNFLKMSYDNAKACAVVETTSDVGQNIVDDSRHIQPELNPTTTLTSNNNNNNFQGM